MSMAHMKPKDQVIRVAIEGNIAAGKSTFLRILATKTDFVVVPEPVSKWQSVGEDSDDEDGEAHFSASQESGGNLLEMFYAEPKRWGFTFQAYALLSRIRAQMRSYSDFLDKTKGTKALTADKFRPKKRVRTTGPDDEADGDAAADAASPAKEEDNTTGAGAGAGAGAAADDGGAAGSGGTASPVAENPKEPVLLFERSVLSDKFCFASNCRSSGLFQEIEWNVYADWHKFLMQAFQGLSLHGIIYLKSKPSTCMDRLKRRGRDEETTIELDYLQSLHERHEEWLVDKVVGREFDVPILIIESDEEFETDDARQAVMLAKVDAFIRSLEAQAKAKASPASPVSPAPATV